MDELVEMELEPLFKNFLPFGCDMYVRIHLVKICYSGRPGPEHKLESLF